MYFNTNVYKVTFIHPKDGDSRTEVIHDCRVEITNKGKDAKVRIHRKATPPWEDLGMEVVVSMDPGNVDFAGYVDGMKYMNPTMSMPIPIRKYSCKADNP